MTRYIYVNGVFFCRFIGEPFWPNKKLKRYVQWHAGMSGASMRGNHISIKYKQP